MAPTARQTTRCSPKFVTHRRFRSVETITYWGGRLEEVPFRSIPGILTVHPHATSPQGQQGKRVLPSAQGISSVRTPRFVHWTGPSRRLFRMCGRVRRCRFDDGHDGDLERRLQKGPRQQRRGRVHRLRRMFCPDEEGLRKPGARVFWPHARRGGGPAWPKGPGADHDLQRALDIHSAAMHSAAMLLSGSSSFAPREA